MVPFPELWREVRRGKSIGRVLTNRVLQEWAAEVRGLVLDLGCGSAPSYWRLMEIHQNPRVTHLVGVDYDISCRPTLLADLNAPLPFKDQAADVVIVGGVIMLLPNPQEFLNEIHRVLNVGGNVLLYASLVWNHDPNPHDYFRFTEDALRLLLERAGFVDIKIVPVGGRWTAAAYLLSPFLRPRPFVPALTYWLCLKLDAWTEQFRIPRCPLGYVAKARIA